MDLKASFQNLEGQVSLIKDPILKKAAFERLLDNLFDTHKKGNVGVNNYRCLTPFVDLLITEGFFDGNRLFKQIRSKLAEKGYHYSRQAVQGGLNNLSKKGGLLLVLEEKEGKKYARRK
jgi:hypothetical protein